MYTVEYTKAAMKALRKMPRDIAGRFLAAFDEIAQAPEKSAADAKPLQGRDGFRLRIGAWRAIYRLDGERLVVLVLAVGLRGDIYK